jgi:BMFP domain-containing protein YqiC
VAVSTPRREAEAELETATGKLRAEIEQLKEKLAASLIKVEANAAKAELLNKVTKLEAKLAESVPRGEVERLRAEIEEQEKKLAASKSEGDSLRAKVAQLQDRLAQSVSKADAEAKANELEGKLSLERREIEVARKTIEDLKGQLSKSSARIGELQAKLSDSIPRTELETTKRQLESRIADLEAKLAPSIAKSQAEEKRIEASAVSAPAETFPKVCTMCGHSNRVDAVFCAGCGRILETEKGKDEKGTTKLTAQWPIEQPISATSTMIGASMGKAARLSKLKSLLGKTKALRNHLPTRGYAGHNIKRGASRAFSSYAGSPTALITTVLALLVLAASFLPIANPAVLAGFCNIANQFLGVRCNVPTAISLAYDFPLLWVLPAGALIVMFSGALSLRTKTRTVKIRGLACCLIGAFNIFALVTYVASVSFVQTYAGTAFVPPELYYPFPLIVVASLFLIWFGVNEWTKKEIRWENLRAIAAQNLGGLVQHVPYSSTPEQPESETVRAPETPPQARTLGAMTPQNERLSTLSTGGAVKTESSISGLISDVKSVPHSEVVTKEQLESQKNITSSPPVTYPGDALEMQLIKLKSLHDSGAITDMEYTQRKRKLLSEV